MKKNLIYWVIALCVGLFTACSQEESANAFDEQSDQVRITAQLPTEFTQVRALPSNSGHQLRCILEVWSQATTPALVYREEKLAASGEISFDFNLKNGTYSSLMWADFVAADAATSNETKDGFAYKHYTDKFYTTTNLSNVAFVDATNANLFNNDACDAFFGSKELVKEAGTANLSTTLTRPFSKLIISDKSKANFAACTDVTVSYKAPQSFNVAEGSASSEMITTSHTAAPLGEGNTDLRLFSHYIFAESNGTLGEIALTFTDYNNDTRTTAIPAGVPTKRNYRTIASGNLLAANTNLDVNVDDSWTDENFELPETVEPTPEATPAKIGDYYYSDGSFGTDATPEGKTVIGIVFDLATEDSKDNYPNLDMDKINGWIVAISDVDSKKAWASKNVSAPIENVSFLANMNACASEFAGYRNSVAISAASIEDTTFPAQAACVAWVPTPSAVVTSGWYMPSIGQLIKLFNVCQTINPKLIEAGGEAMKADVYLTSTLYNGSNSVSVSNLLKINAVRS